MCERGFYNIKSVSNLGSKYAFVPCGECPSCRNIKRQSWAFRLRVEAETLVKQGWTVGFMTFTYNDKNVPRIPYHFVKRDFRREYSQYKMPMCFSRDDINGLIKYVRNWMYRERKIAHDLKLRFLISSEFGDTTKRPHYHGLFIIPPNIKAVDFYNKLKEFWTKKGFIIPAEFEGGYDDNHVYHKPFVVDCVSKACVYASKYVCKDLAFYDVFNKEHFKKYVEKDGIEYKLTDWLPFHSQSKSLGISFLNQLTDSQKIDYFVNGVSFLGDDRLRHLPVYLKNKLIFSNYYVVDSMGQRFCRRIASKFFDDNYKQIFAEKKRLVSEKLRQWLAQNPKVEIGNKILSCQEFFKQLNVTPDNLSAQYIAYYGVSPEFCYVMPLDRFWYERYQYVTDGVEIVDELVKQLQNEPWRYLTIDPLFKRKMETFFTLFQQMDNERLKKIDFEQIKDERLISGIRDFYYQ